MSCLYQVYPAHSSAINATAAKTAVTTTVFFFILCVLLFKMVPTTYMSQGPGFFYLPKKKRETRWRSLHVRMLLYCWLFCWLCRLQNQIIPEKHSRMLIVILL